MNARTILLDADGPLAGYDQRAWELCNQFAMDIDAPHEKSLFYMTDHVIDPDERLAARALLNAQGFFRSLPVVEGAQAGVDKLLADGHDVWICTRPARENRTCRDEKYAWVIEHFPELQDKLIIAYDKSCARGDILLDDAPTLTQAARALWKPVIFTTTYNGPGTEWADLPHWDWTSDRPLVEMI